MDWINVIITLILNNNVFIGVFGNIEILLNEVNHYIQIQINFIVNI